MTIYFLITPAPIIQKMQGKPLSLIKLSMIPWGLQKNNVKSSPKKPQSALRNTKALLKPDLRRPIESVIKEQWLCFGEGLQGAECKEAVTAFFENRPSYFPHSNSDQQYI